MRAEGGSVQLLDHVQPCGAIVRSLILYEIEGDATKGLYAGKYNDSLIMRKMLKRVCVHSSQLD